MSTVPTVDDLVRQVPQGETRLFERRIKDAAEDRFLAVHYNHDYPRRLDWRNELPFDAMPWMGNRHKPRIPISVLPVPDMIFEGKSASIVDFYAHGGAQVFFISDRLCELIGAIDPDSLDQRPMTIKASDGTVSFNVVMPARNLDAVDPERTDVLVKDQKLATQWFRSVQFPTGAVFREEALAGVHNFSDVNVQGWFWSRELIDAAKAAGIKGIYTMRAGLITGSTIDRL